MTPTPKVTTNPEQRLYIIPSGDGFSCWGFDNCYAETKALAERLNRPLPLESQIGTLEQYRQHAELIQYAAVNKIDLGTWYKPGTPVIIQTILDHLIKSREEVRIYHGDKLTGRDWMEEHATVGRIGRSTGILKIPLLVPKGSDGGSGLFTDSIVRIQLCATREDLWRQSNYHLPELTIKEEEGNHHAVLADNEVHARFPSLTKASNYVAFLKGERFKP